MEEIHQRGPGTILIIAVEIETRIGFEWTSHDLLFSIGLDHVWRSETAWPPRRRSL